VRFAGTCYRFHDPRWSFAPTSGGGAAIHGGRFNPKGVEALYLALTIETAFVEISQGFAEKFKPAVLIAYEIDCDDIVDLRTDVGRKHEGVELADMACAWFGELAAGREPPSWMIARRFIAAKAAGLMVPSFAAGADPERHQNLVLWRWHAELPHRVRVHDPDGRLPKDQSSWGGKGGD
jgi:RES domain-containing protein